MAISCLYESHGVKLAVKIVKLSWEKDPATGRMKMQEIAGSEQTLDAEIVLIAAGFLGTQKYIADAFGVELNERTNVKTAPGKYQTSIRDSSCTILRDLSKGHVKSNATADNTRKKVQITNRKR